MAEKLGNTSTADEVLAGIDLRGKRVLVTGVSSGIGAETARALMARGAKVVGTVRDPAKVQSAPDAIEIVPLDLVSFASVRACADNLVRDGKPLDLVFANAGVMATPFGLTTDGFETQFGTNHLGHFLLINRIAPLIRSGGRLVMLSSSAHRGSDVDLDDPNFADKPYNPWQAYSQSKTANMLFAVEFDRRHGPRGIRACGIHPGRVDTGLFRHLGEGGLEGLVGMVDKGLTERGLPPSLTKTPAQGAATSVWAAVVAEASVIGGRFCEDCQVSPVNDNAERLANLVGVRSYAIDPVRAGDLWAKSEQWVGERFE